MNENINLCEILKDCPKGTELYSSIHGKVLFSGINKSYIYPIEVVANEYDNKEFMASFAADGRSLHFCAAEYVLFPSKDQRDWSKWQCPKPKFDPKTLKPFDKVLVRNKCGKWKCGLFSHFDDEESEYIWCCVGSEYIRIIPYNDETKYLVGTSDEVPEFYRYWEN